MPAKLPTEESRPLQPTVAPFNALATPTGNPFLQIARVSDPLVRVPKRRLGAGRIFAGLLALILILGVVTVELIGGVMGGSAVLSADALVFAANALQILAALIVPRSHLANAKLFLAGLTGILAIAVALWSIYLPSTGALPEGFIITPIAAMALGVHIGITLLFIAFESDDERRDEFKRGAAYDIPLTGLALIAGFTIWWCEWIWTDMVAALAISAIILFASWQKAMIALDDIDLKDERAGPAAGLR